MFKRALLAVFLVFSAVGISIETAEAKRLGGGGSTGMQRSIPQRQAMPPSYQQRQPAAAPAAAPAPQQSGWRRWAGPLAGLAAGIGLAALMSHLGLGADFANLLLLVIGGVIVFALLRRFLKPRTPQPATAAGPAWQQQAPAQYEAAPQAAGGGAYAAAATGQAPNIPADFDVPAFTRQAKVNFIRLQAANDAGNLEDIREFTTPEMFAEIKLDIDSRRGATQKTDVVVLEADVIEVVEEANRYITTVRFYGSLREEAGAPPAPFDEVWHLSKPRDGAHGWTLAGIQQVL
ncbi:Tim44-like domain-containing protein [Uliginosibacterium sediminicola]|uniref:Tim44-like domain-containing protein n=1 Tax=Uliginosibacterium sediminicola TaxID=2024550 RepID=A0ABU9YUD7_9RHOO